MIKKIKVKLLIGKLFSHIIIPRELKIIRFNKRLQKDLEVTIIHYKNLSGKYIALTENDKGKEINCINGKIMYEGGIVGGKRNGEGKEYDNDGILIYEGEFFNGSRWNGTGKEFDQKGNLIFEGKYSNGMKYSGKIYRYVLDKLVLEGEYFFNNLNGNLRNLVKEYDYEGRLIYKGEYLNEVRDGDGEEYDANGKCIFSGKYLNGERYVENGGYYIYKKNFEHLNVNTDVIEMNKEIILLFEGSYINDQIWNGKGKELNMDGNLIYDGSYLCGKRSGYGKEYKNDELIFEGIFINGKRWKGIGKEFNDVDEIIFEGTYLNGQRWEGRGKEFSINNSITFEGSYLNGQRWNGRGREIFFEETMFEGIYINGKRNGDIQEFNGNFEIIFVGGCVGGKGSGYCFELNDKGKIIFEGDYQDGKRNGKGKLYNADNLIFDGEFLNGLKLKGKEYVAGKLEYEGLYLYDKKWDGKGYDKDGHKSYSLINGNGKVREYFNEVLIFDGEYLRGEKNGEGREYNLSGKLIFAGEYCKGKRLKGATFNYGKRL